MEYLSQLLGEATPEILEFVDNVGRFERGEPLTLAVPTANKASATNEEKAEEKPAATPTPKNEPSQQTTSKKNALQARRGQKQNKSRVPPPKKKNPPAGSAKPDTKTSGSTIPQQPVLKASVPPAKKEAAAPASEDLCPTKGKAKIVCGCFGTKHKALTNCLICGRISCSKEGYDFCASCGWLVEVREG